MSETKHKIMLSSKHMFNKHGYGAVSLFEIAQHMNMSRGNLTYHFRDKDELLTNIANEMWEKIATERQKTMKLPSFKNLHNEVQLYYKFQKEYAFIFHDPHVLTHPKIKKQFREITAQSIKDNKEIIAFSIGVGNMRPEAFPGLYNNIAFITWMITFFWSTQQIIRGDRKQDDGEKLIWSILLPHLTEKGLKNFKKYFGDSYINSLGDPFDIDLESLISF